MISPNDGRESGVSETYLPETIAKVFQTGGWLQASLGLEHRPQQEAMANAVAGHMAIDRPIIFEAGTGVGKSLAYLVPGIIHAMESKRPCIVSSHTIALQEQIQKQDLVLCRELFNSLPALQKYADFKSTVLVGKGNYLCPTRLANSLKNQQELFPSDEQLELQRIADWAQFTKTGLRQELKGEVNFDVWESVSADGSACNRKNCSPEHCFYQKARAEVRKVQVVIVNHSLLFALINAGGLAPDSKGILLPDDFLVIDEAHTAPEVATEHFGARLSSYGLDRQLKGIYNPKRKTGIAKRLAHPKQLQAIIDAQEASEGFFEYIANVFLDKRPISRVSEPDWVEPNVLPPLKAAVETMDSILAKIEDGPLHDEVKDYRSRIHSYFSGIQRFIALSEKGHVHWLERSGRKRRIVTLRTAPIDVAPYLKEELFSKKTSVVLTSATLSIARRLDPFLVKVGAEGHTALSEDSPFDYENNTRIYIASDIPAPSKDDASLAMDALIDYLHFCVSKIPGGSLILFTSYSDLRQAHEALEARFLKADRPVFAQGQGLTRSEIIKGFRAAGNGVLFGTDSFWTGIDVPGTALSQVIITRLPFEVPTHPIAEARSERIKEQGGNPFADLTLPDALIKFRQGIGRLIRKKDDKGVITLLDSRALHKAYGRQFLQSLPKTKFIRITREDRDARFCDINVTPDALRHREPRDNPET